MSANLGSLLPRWDPSTWIAFANLLIAAFVGWLVWLTWIAQRRLGEVQLRPELRVSGLATDAVVDNLTVGIFNVGGAALESAVLFQSGRRLFLHKGPFPAHSSQVIQYSPSEVATLPEAHSFEGTRIVGVLAQAGDGNWWDVTARRKLGTLKGWRKNLRWAWERALRRAGLPKEAVEVRKVGKYGVELTMPK